MPVTWVSLARRLLLRPVPARSGPKSSRDEASVLQGTLIRGQILRCAVGDPNKRPDSVPNATSAP